MTFLEYLCGTLSGPPISTNGNGESYWPCPQCGGERFHTLPHKPKEKDRFRCWTCLFRGDDIDLLRHFHPRERYPELLQRKHEIQVDFDRDQAANLLPPTASSALAFPPRGRGEELGEVDPRLVGLAFDELTPEEREAIVTAHAVIARSGVSFYALAVACLDHRNWVERTDEIDREEEERAEQIRERVERIGRRPLFVRTRRKYVPSTNGRNGHASH
jgi:hypothetical protein